MCEMRGDLCARRTPGVCVEQELLHVGEAPISDEHAEGRRESPLGAGAWVVYRGFVENAFRRI